MSKQIIPISMAELKERLLPSPKPLNMFIDIVTPAGNEYNGVQVQKLNDEGKPLVYLWYGSTLMVPPGEWKLWT